MSLSRFVTRLFVPLLLFVNLPLFAAPASAAPGDLDPTFGTGGIVITRIFRYETASAMAIQSDGKVVVVGYSTDDEEGCCEKFTLRRYTPSGALDTTFGSGGQVTTSIGAGADVAYAVAIQSDGKIVVAGSRPSANRGSNFALVRYRPTGALDTTFGSRGKVTTDFGISDDVAYAIVIQPDGKIAVGGYRQVGSNFDFALARYGPSGALDPTFGSGGKVITPIGTGFDAAHALAIQPDGKIVAGGAGAYDFAMARYTPTGALDPTFGSGGKVTTDISPFGGVAVGMALQPDGKIVLAGRAFTVSVVEGFALARYAPKGELDPTFGSGGTVTTSSPTGGSSGARGVAIQSDGKIVAAGSGGDGFMVARYLG